jgi:hypothetical protein
MKKEEESICERNSDLVVVMSIPMFGLGGGRGDLTKATARKC